MTIVSILLIGNNNCRCTFRWVDELIMGEVVVVIDGVGRCGDHKLVKIFITPNR